MTDLAKIAGLIAGERISEATDLFRQAQPGAGITVMFGALLGAGFQDEGVECLKWEARRTEGSENLDLLKFLTAMLYNMKDYEEAEPFAETLCRIEPEFGLWYTIRAWARMAAGDPAGVRKVIADAQEKITVHGIDFQPSMPPVLLEFEAEAEEALSERRREYLAEAESGKKPSKGAAKGKKQNKKPSKKKNPQVDTGNACERDTTGAILSGRIAGISAPGTYCFRYGAGSGALDRRTPWKPLPPGVWGEVRAPLLETANQWKVCAVEHAVDGEAGGVLLRAPFGKDRNHLSGVGIADLWGGWSNTLKTQKITTRGLRAGCMDLRDAEFVLRIKTENFEPEDFLFTFNTQATIAQGESTYWAPWTLSARPVDLDGFEDGDWRDVAITFNADPEEWSFCGNNPAEQDDHARYSYGPLGTVLENQSGNLFLWMLYGDWRRTPEGKLWLAEGRLRHRDWNILRDEAFSSLTDAPEASLESAGKLTDGRRGHPGDGWTSVGMAPGPKSFEWRFAEAVELTDIVLHPHPLFPARNCLIEVDGKKGEPFHHSFRMPESSATSRVPSVVSLPEGLEAESLRITLQDGYHDGHVGLEAVEAFADAWAPVSGASPLTVCEDIGDLPAGSAIHYRLCCRSGDTETQGEVRSLDLPADAVPRLNSLYAYSRVPDKAIYLVRGNAMGRETRLLWWIDQTEPAVISFGHETTRQHRAITIRGSALDGETLYARLESEEGASATLEASLS